MELLFDNDVRLTIGSSWQPLNAMPEDPPGTHVFGKATENCECFVSTHPIDVKYTMQFDNPQEIISGIHEALAGNQALIEVKSNVTSESKMVYSIVKTQQQPSGVQYSLTMDIVVKNRAVHLQGFFSETGTTGQRDAAVYELERQNGNVTINFDGWNFDPYDANSQRQYRMNLSEQEKYDNMFPQHPLSIA